MGHYAATAYRADGGGRKRLVVQSTNHELGGGALIPAVAAGVLHLGLYQFDEVSVIQCRTREPLGYDGV